MGNSFGKHKTDAGAAARNKIYRSQDLFVHDLVDTSHGEEEDNSDDDTESNIPDKEEEERRKSLWNTRSVVCKEYDEIDSRVLKVNLSKYEFPFENLVFEGGGSKGLGYCGAVRVLEELGILKNIKRFAGASAGAIIATLLAVGYDSYQIEDFSGIDLSKILMDHKCGYFSLIPNLIRRYGWNSGTGVLTWFGKHLEEATGNADITFGELYDRYGKELCVVVTNLNMMNTEYFHPKTTPTMPIRVAVRMSMSIPGLFQASKYNQNGQVNTYVDGGLLCNYPINCFDGWWLSMKKEDSFLNRLQPVEELAKLFENKERFGVYNKKTLGLMVYADNERYFFRDLLQERVGVDLPEFPKTKLATEKMRKKTIQEKVKIEHKHTLHAVNAFLKVLQKHNKDNDEKISEEEFKNAMNDTDEFPRRYVERLFGKDVTVDEAMAALDENQDGEIYFHELLHFIERTGVSLQARFLGYDRKEIKGVVSFFDTLQDALLTNIMRITVQERDMARTIGINTGHVGTADFKLEYQDREYLVNQGERATEAYLRYFVVENNLPVKEGYDPDFDPPSSSESTPLSSTSGFNGSSSNCSTEQESDEDMSTCFEEYPVDVTPDTDNAVKQVHVRFQEDDNLEEECTTYL